MFDIQGSCNVSSISLIFNVLNNAYKTSIMKFLLTSVLFLTLTVNISGQEIIEKYGWLSDFVDPSDCMQQKITEYDLGPYAFILLSEVDESILFFETGQIFCFGSLGYNCLEAYNLKDDQIGLQFACSDPGNGSESLCDPFEVYNRIENEFPWVQQFGNPVGCGLSEITVYQRGVHKYINVESSSTSTLFYQSGNVLCQNTDNFNCAQAYGFDEGEVIEKFNCEQLETFCFEGMYITGSYTFDFISFGECEFWENDEIDLVGLETNCFVNSEGLERCLNGTIKVSENGEYQYSYNVIGPGANGGVSANGGSGSGQFVFANGVPQNCFGNDCIFANMLFDGNRLEFNTIIEGCPVRLGGYK